MKKIISFMFMLILSISLIACSNVETKKDIELMGAGDRIHDTYTFANVGVELKETAKNTYLISGSVDKLDNSEVKGEFEIDEDVTHVVAVKLSSNGKEVIKEKVVIKVNGVRNYDAEHLNADDYTFIILEANPNTSVSISVKWNGEDENIYTITFEDDLILK